jgi:hypothetical protein
MLGVRAFWQVSERNALDVSFDFGYEHYLNGARPSRVIVTGDENSGIFYDIYVGDFVIDLHEKLSLSQDTSSDPTVSGIADIFRLENTAGVTVTWDLNKIVLNANYDHFNYVPLDSTYEYLTRASDLVSLRGAVSLNPALMTGIELGAGVTRYDSPLLSNNRHTSIGPFVRYALSSTADLRASVGFTGYTFDPSSFITNATDQTGFYADVLLTHQPTQRTAQSLSFGQSLTTDINSKPVQLLYVRYAVTLNIIRHWRIQPHFTYESGTESHGVGQEDFTRYGAGLSLSRQLTQKLSGSLSYSLLNKSSSVAAFDYEQNRLVLNVLYQF